jgi:hypothetical protein
MIFQQQNATGLYHLVRETRWKFKKMFIVSVVHLEAATPNGEQMSTVDHFGAARRMENDNLQIIPKQQDKGNVHFTKNYPTLVL